MNKSIRLINDNYISPEKAAHKLRAARKFHTPLYLYGVTGIGKTSLVMNTLNMRRCTYYSAAETIAEKLELKEWEGEHTVVIDDLHCVTDSDQRELFAEKIRKLLDQENIWLILIARCPFPRWLLGLRTKYVFAEIPEEDFYLTLEEQKLYTERAGLLLSDEEHQAAWEVGRGLPMSLVFFVMEKGDIERTKKRIWDLLETQVYDQWDIQMQDFFMNVSIVESFTIQLAAMLTGRNDVEGLIAEAELTGNFFEATGENGFWKCRWEMRASMQQRLRRKKTTEQIKRLYYTAGLYYEMNNRIPEALSMYEKFNDVDSISRLLISNARKNPSCGHFFELRKYYLALPEQIVEESPVLMAGLSMLQSMLLNIEESDRWYHALEEYGQKHSGSPGREARSRLLYLKIGLPHTGTVNMVDLLKNADILLRDRKAALPELSVTSNLPSVMNGGKDFCEWSKRDRELAGSIGKPVSFVLGKYGKGLVSLALAESFFEKGGDIFEIFSCAERGRMEADSGGKPELVFVGTGLLAWLSILKNDAQGAEDSLLSMRERAEKEAPNLLENIDAFLSRIHLYQGKDVSDWLNTAPDEKKEFYTMERFCYLTKVRIYIQLGKYEAAYCLLQQLLYYAQVMSRTYILMEVQLLLSIVQYHTGQEQWKDTLQQCITKAEEYHFVRLFSREGAAIHSLLEKEKFLWKDGNYKKQVLAECRQMAEAYPSYLRGGVENQVVLAGNAIRILKMQMEGLSAAEIARKLKISEATVKYHSRETYRKLGVKNKTAAIAEAKKRKII